MTDKKEKILKAALELFATDGYSGTSTNKVAKRAGVSEGLIFKHFCNKEGLLLAVLAQGEEKAKAVFADIVLETEPFEVIRKTIDLSETMLGNSEDANFWKLQYKVKWEVEKLNERKMEPLEIALTNAFEKLEYINPKMEARTLILMMDGIAMRFFLQEGFNMQEVVDFLKCKYKL